MTSGGPPQAPPVPDGNVPDRPPTRPGTDVPAVPPGRIRIGILVALCMAIAAVAVVVASLVPGTGATVNRAWPGVFGLVFPIFGVSLLAFMTTFRDTRRRSLLRVRADPWRIMARWLPRPAFVALITLGVLGVVNFALFATTMGGDPEEHGGRYYADDHGVLTELTAEQYDQWERNLARGFSGHAVVLFSISAGLLLASSRRRWVDQATDETRPMR